MSPFISASMRQQCSAQIQFAFHRHVRFAFNLLRRDFAQDQLLSKIFRTDHDAAVRGSNDSAGPAQR